MRDDAAPPVSALEQENIPGMDDLYPSEGDTGNLSAEEAAMHLTSEDEAPGLSWDDSPGYINVEERS